MISGSDLVKAAAGIPQNQVSWVVDLEFNSTAAATFEQVTKEISTRTSPQNQFAIVLDGDVITAPYVSNAIPGGRAQISGSFTQQSATELANVLKYGALPLAFDVSSVDTVSAKLGGEQLEAGIIAGIIGLVLVIAYSVIYYRALALVVVSSLVVAFGITYAFIVLLGQAMGFALNLPGVAGLIVAIGVTADSFVIYFERIRDEVRDGRSLRTAIEVGWVRSRRTILVADGVSLLSAVVLFILAIGAVKGFAFTLGLTTLIDLRDALRNNDSDGITLAGSQLDQHLERVTATHALVGVYAQRVDLATTRQENLSLQDESMKSQLQDVDFTEASIRYSALRTQLQASLTLGGQSQSQTLLDFLG